jgi:hypothetical protein
MSKLKTITAITFVTILFVLNSCNQDDKKVITEKIQYDVNIKSPDADYDWWIQNLPGPDREKLVKLIIEGAKSGKFKAYDYFQNPISTAEVRSIMADTIALRLMETEAPYKEYDTTIVNVIHLEDIHRLRFLEKWEIDEKSLQVEKTVYAIAPIARRIDLNGIERWQPLFWIYTDESFLRNN